jgi:predicted TIM-barrel fold metal-dependent hydrolase
MSGLIDVHHHFMSQAYLDAVGVERAASPGSAGHVEPWTAQQSLEFMDMAGIDAAVISVSAPGIDMGTPLATADLARVCNEAQARMVRDYPKRFGSLAILPLPHIELSLGEIKYAFDTLNADGVVMMSNYGGEYIGSPKFWPVFEELERRKAVAFFHPVAPENYRGFPGVSLSTMEFPFDTARAIMSMLYHGTPEKFPNVRMVFSHAGGAMPYLAGRTAVLSQRNKNFQLSGDKLMPTMRRLYYDVTQSLSAPTFAALRALARPDHLLFGSDCPFAKEQQVRAVLGELDQLALPAAERARLERGNALKLFPRLTQT